MNAASISFRISFSPACCGVSESSYAKLSLIPFSESSFSAIARVPLP
jgi:hypothetical protein